MVNSISPNHQPHLSHHQLFSLLMITKVVHHYVLLPFLINSITCSIQTIKATSSTKSIKRLNQPFLPSQGEPDQKQDFLWAIVLIATIMLIFLSICFCRCYYRYNEICDEQKQQLNQQFNSNQDDDYHYYQPSSSTSTPTPQVFQLTNPIAHEIKFNSNDPCSSELIVHHYLQHGRASIKIDSDKVINRQDSKFRRQSTLRSSV